MPNYTEFEGINLITDPTQKTIAEVLIKNELGGASNGYRLDHADTSNSGVFIWWKSNGFIKKRKWS